MNLKENNYKAEFLCEEIMPFEERVLTSGLCDFVIPMTLSKYRGKKKVVYDCSGYISISDMKPCNTNEVFEVLEKTLISLNKSTEFLLKPAKVTLDIETVYYNLKKKNIKIAYMPSKSQSVKDNINHFIDELTSMANEETVEYLLCVKKNMEMYNQNISELIKFVREQRRTLRLCGI